MARGQEQGFTLIEMSIVLVILGLIVGGILVGQTLISSAGVRATITQIDKYNTAVSTFQQKYGGLPGDLNATAAAQYGFVARGNYAGMGDGDGVIQGVSGGGGGHNNGTDELEGETAVFWVDLSTAGLIDGPFTAAAENSMPGYNPTLTSTPFNIDSFLPQAKIGRGNYIYVSSYGSTNYYGIAPVTQIPSKGLQDVQPAKGSYGGLTVAEAYSIDSKIDDGLPTTGKVTALIVWGFGDNMLYYANLYSHEDPYTGAPDTEHSGGYQQTCYDWFTHNQQTYSLSQNNGAGVNCALVFEFSTQ